MLTAITHTVSPRITECELTFLERSPIDLGRAVRQHEEYCATLERLGARVITLDGNEAFPDSVFVEDDAVVVDEIAVICRPGAESRRGETDLIELELRKHRETVRIEPPATIDGGDVLVIGRTIFVGVSARTNSKGAAALGRILEAFGYDVVPVVTLKCLHLKSACTAISGETLVANPEWIDTDLFKGYEVIRTAAGEEHSANVLRIGGTVCVPAGAPKTAEAIAAAAENVVVIDNSELRKAEAGLTCSSIIFSNAG